MIQWLPAMGWMRSYNRHFLAKDMIAAAIVTVLLIPQSLAYAMLAGVPPEVGLYSSLLPLVAYALFGSSRTLSVGPVAVISLMTATTVGQVAAQGTVGYLTAASTLALLSGAILLVMGFLRMGFVTNFLSHSVISGFISASGIIIAFGQLPHVLGVSAHGETLRELLPSLVRGFSQIHLPTLILAGGVIAFLFWTKLYAGSTMRRWGIAKQTADIWVKTAPMVGVIASILAVYLLHLDRQQVAIIGAVPSGLPRFALAIPPLDLVRSLALPAFLIALIGFVESISVGKTLAAKRRQRVDANQELIGLGAANIASSVTGGFPVTGGFSRSVVNFEAGAVTQAASIFTAVGIAFVSLLLTPVLFYLPKATLAATIIVAILGLVDFAILKKTWVIARSDFYAVFSTIVITLLWGVEIGVACGVGLSLVLHLYRTSTPHIAEVGLVEGTQHFRNIRRYHVHTLPQLMTLRLDESLFFASAAHLENRILEEIYQRDQIAHVVLLCSAVNEIDYSALEVLEALNTQLADQGILLHLAEVKGRVIETLTKANFLQHLSGKVFLSQFDAFEYVRKLEAADAPSMNNQQENNQ